MFVKVAWRVMWVQLSVVLSYRNISKNAMVCTIWACVNLFSLLTDVINELIFKVSILKLCLYTHFLEKFWYPGLPGEVTALDM